MKKLSVFMIIVLLFLPVLSLYSCDVFSPTSTMIGEIKHIDYNLIFEEEPENHYYYIYVKPYGQDDSSRWEKFSVNSKADTESPFSVYIADMPELAVGSIVEIEYYTKIGQGSNINLCYGVKSIKSVGSSTSIEKQNHIPLIINEDFSYTKLINGKVDDVGTVIHVTKLETPLNGYLVYFDGTQVHGCNEVQCYWIGDQGLATTDPDIIKKLEAGETGYSIKFLTVASQMPFKNYRATAIMSIEAYNP